MKFLISLLLLFSLSITVARAQRSTWFKGTWYGERTFTNARVALKTPVRIEIEEVTGSLFQGHFIYMYPSDTTARLVRRIEGKIYDKYIIITKSVETYLMDPRSRSFWSDCSQCPGASSFFIENGTLVLKIESYNCGDTCNGETVFRRKLYTYDSVTQVAIFKQINRNKVPANFRPFTSADPADAALAAKRDSVKYFPVLIKGDMSVHFNRGKYVLPSSPAEPAIASAGVVATTDHASQKTTVSPPPVIVKDTAATVVNKTKETTKPAVKKEGKAAPVNPLNTTPAVTRKDTMAALPVPVKDTIPAAITQRSTKLVTTYEVSSPRIAVQLFDDGQIDGDAVSVYYNGQLIVNNRTLTHKAITFNIEATAANRHHEFILISESVGFMAPNTALMRITAGEQHFELTVSSTMESNAKIAIDYTGE